MGVASRLMSSFAAIISALSYPSHPASLAVFLLTISDSLAVAVSFRRSTTFTSGNGRPLSDFDCLGFCRNVVRSRLVVYKMLANRSLPQHTAHGPVSNHNSHEDSHRRARYSCRIGGMILQGTSQPIQDHPQWLPCKALPPTWLGSVVYCQIGSPNIKAKVVPTFHALGAIRRTSSKANIDCWNMPWET